MVINIDKQEKLIKTVEKLQSDLDSLKQEIRPSITNGAKDDFKTIVRSVEKNNQSTESTAKLDGDIETI